VAIKDKFVEKIKKLYFELLRRLELRPEEIVRSMGSDEALPLCQYDDVVVEWKLCIREKRRTKSSYLGTSALTAGAAKGFAQETISICIQLCRPSSCYCKSPLRISGNVQCDV